MTANLMSAIQPYKNIKKIISTSAIGYYGDRGLEKLTEDSSKGSDFLSDVCAEWELAATKDKPSHLSVSILRIGIVLSNPEEGGILKKITPVFKSNLGSVLGNGKQIMSWIQIEDLISIILSESKKLEPLSVVNAVAPNPVSNEKFTVQLCKKLKKIKFLPVPKIALNLALGERSALLLSSQNVICEKLLKEDFQFKYPKIELAFDEIFKES